MKPSVLHIWFGLVGLPFCMSPSASAQTLYVPYGTVSNSGVGSVVLSQSYNHPWGFGIQADVGWVGWARQYAFHSSDGTQLAALWAKGNSGNTLERIVIGRGVDAGGALGPEWLTVLPNGHVGIGSTSPVAPLHVVGGPAMTAGWNRTGILQATYPVLAFNSTAGNKWAGIGYDAGWAMRFWVNGSSNDVPGSGTLAMSINDAGSVGIGAAPNFPLTVGSGAQLVGSNPTFNLRETDFADSDYDLQVNDGKLRIYDVNDARSSFQQRVVIDTNGNVGIGTPDPGTNRLAVNGTIRAKEVIVEASPWPDFVFENGYRLAPLSEVEAHIEAEGHLPGVPSAATVAEHGVAVGEMQRTLLRKIEELTLYVIDLKKENTALQRKLETENAAFRVELEALKQTVNH